MIVYVVSCSPVTNTAVSSYKFEIAVNGAAPYILSSTTNTLDRAFNYGDSLVIRAAATGVAGTGDWSAPVSVQVISEPLPDAPQNVSAAPKN